MQPLAKPKHERLSVEYNLTEHCNLSCYACDHASPLLPRKFATVEDFARDFEALADVFHSKQLRVVGGEPLLHPQLFDFLKEARRIGIADAIVLITNGVLLPQMPDQLWELIDQLWVSVYPGIKSKFDEEKYTEICKARDIRLEVWRVDKFYRTIINDRIEDPALVKKIFQECKMVSEYSCHTVHEGRFYKCSVAPFMGPRLALRGVDFNNYETDGISLHNNPTLYEDIDRCLNGPTPLAACSFCLGTSGPLVAHRQANRQGRSDWLNEDNRPDIEVARANLTADS